jgi:hypothetical protein
MGLYTTGNLYTHHRSKSYKEQKQAPEFIEFILKFAYYAQNVCSIGVTLPSVIISKIKSNLIICLFLISPLKN